MFNNFEDTDGCPDDITEFRPNDVDSDGIPNDSDFCITAPETPNGYLDEDGCPGLSGRQHIL